MDRYRLAPLRDARTRDERLQRNALTSAVGESRATAADVETSARRVDAARRSAAAARVASLPSVAHSLALADRYAARLRRDLDAAIGEHLRARAAHAGRLAELDLARERLARARADKEVIERNFERWRESQRRLVERRAD